MCLQIKFAFRVSTESLHTLVHVPSRQISSIPALLEAPPTNLASPVSQLGPMCDVPRGVTDSNYMSRTYSRFVFVHCKAVQQAKGTRW